MRPITTKIPAYLASSAMLKLHEKYVIHHSFADVLLYGFLRVAAPLDYMDERLENDYLIWLDVTEYAEAASKEAYRGHPEAARNLLGFIGR